ncbi:DUF456 domain-containing protein [Mycolicibacterium arenosum]|uniref:DUF456 domain-containing protein n=1 Tax=Mycolicibacterium arenosum TaxID=2952157 RepID=A0ABT1LZZ3_9MYCO|nr:DUF456 domain-containing protein [Mycolicibacterium sp. CAU 1645]MCP9272478.1 DUF456 domain-containing protein [Mycolicibacterium sp. CAU 1645]
MDTLGLVLVGVAIFVGLLGILLPLLPGTLLVFAAILVWALVERTTIGWVTLGVVTVLLGAALLIKYLWPAKRMKTAEVGTWSLLAGGVLGIVGFFVIPVVGLIIGFVLGVYLAELGVRKDQRLAWTSTKHAMKGVALSILVELAGALLAAGVWLGAVLVF